MAGGRGGLLAVRDDVQRRMLELWIWSTCGALAVSRSRRVSCRVTSLGDAAYRRGRWCVSVVRGRQPRGECVFDSSTLTTKLKGSMYFILRYWHFQRFQFFQFTVFFR